MLKKWSICVVIGGILAYFYPRMYLDLFGMERIPIPSQSAGGIFHGFMMILPVLLGIFASIYLPKSTWITDNFRTGIFITGFFYASMLPLSALIWTPLFWAGLPISILLVVVFTIHYRGLLQSSTLN